MDRDKIGSSEEIDLLYFFNPVIELFRKAGSLLLSLGKKLLRNAGLFFAIVAVASIAGFSLRFFIPKYYKTTAVFVSRYLPAHIALLNLDELTSYAADNNSGRRLALRLKVPENIAAAIHSVHADAVDNNEYKYKFDTAGGAAFKVTLRLTAVTGVPQIQEALQALLENNDYAITRKRVRRRTLEIMKDNLLDMSKSLDSLKAVYQERVLPLSRSQVLIMNQPVVPLELYNMVQENSKKISLLEQDLGDLENIEIIKPFSSPPAFNDPDFKKLFLYFLVGGLLAAVVLTPILGRR